MNRYQILVEYVGTNYNGWQIQKKGKTIQGKIQKVISKILKEKININYKNYKKIGSLTDARYWMKTKDFREKLTSLIEEKNSISRNFLNLNEIKKIMMVDKNERFFFIKWSLFNLETWRKKNFLQNKL